MLQVADGNVVAKDLESSNGSFLNGQRLTTARDVADGDCVTVGESDLIVRILAPDREGLRAAAPTICAGCGAELGPGVAFCSSCGQRVARSFATVVVGAAEGVSSEERTAPVSSRPEAPPLPPPPAPLSDVELASTPMPRSRAAPAFPPPAGFWIRVLAALIDGAAIWLASLLVAMPFGGPTSELGRPTVAIASLVIGALVPIVGWVRWGTTPGKAALRLVVCTTDGEVGLTFPQALLRWLGYFPSALILGVGFFMVGLTTSKRGLHDFLAGTYVGIDRG